MPTWPTTLPVPKQSGYNLDPSDQTLRTDMEVGPARVRRITSTRNDIISLQVEMTASQFAEFREWFENSTTGIAGGSLWFSGLTLITDESAVTDIECRFSERFTAALQPGLKWLVTAKVEVR